MWIKLNSLSGLIFVIYPQGVLVSAKKKPWMFEIFSICQHPLSLVAIKSIFLVIPINKQLLGPKWRWEVNKTEKNNFYLFYCVFFWEKYCTLHGLIK